MFPRLDELEWQHRLRAANEWCTMFRLKHGRWPTVQELSETPALTLPPPPPGREFLIVDGEVKLADRDDSY